MAEIIQINFGKREYATRAVIEAESKAVEAIAERNIDERTADVLESWNKHHMTLGRHIGAGVYVYKDQYYHIGTGKIVFMKPGQNGNAGSELLIIILAIIAIAAVALATVAFPASVLLGTLQQTIELLGR